MSFLTHIGVFILLETALGRAWTGSWCAFYDLCAIFASIAGVIGAVDRRPAVFSIYAFVHTIVVVVITSIFLLNALPTAIAAAIPFFPQQLRYTENLETSMCREDGFGWDDHWIDQCRSAFAILSTSAIWIGVAMMAAQWWAISEVWRWVGSECNRKKRVEMIASIEEAEYVDKKQG
ncbi:hypothetical protein K458DRAFT_402852 [Lentithecium fluviatile CBS 122367]|uniref:MARVEL domain-containing protein n=1 Tax=Lentithecium fluviatile CBS 122367 TaxID=1168545 RepID=A0A6G1J857_9PLEO|nr:hypothetical protein K458DRAFT_402852 [Lentithecium fluviatile CBS 122367]